MNRESAIIEAIEADLKLQKESPRSKLGNLGNVWGEAMLKEPRRFIDGDIKIKRDALRNFRRKKILVPDVPLGRQSIFNPINAIDGARRGHAKMLKGFLKIIEDAGFEGLLKKYPCSTVGNPDIFRYKGYIFTLRWIRHIYLLGRFKQYIEPKLGSDFTLLDLGTSYGIFPALMKREYNRSRYILVDLPQQLALAHYFLSLEFPSASIATYKDIAKLDSIDKDVIEKYDFILVPPYLYEKIAKESIDVFANFMSLAEMSREYFEYYLTKEPFLSARFFFTANRYDSAPTYDNGLTVLNYPLSDFATLRFATTPLVSERYRRKAIFFYTYFPYPSQLFEFIGERKGF